MKIKAIILSLLLCFFAIAPVKAVAAEATELPYFYFGLTDAEKAAYDELREAVAENTDTLTIEAAELPLTADSMNRIISVLLYYDPEHFNVSDITADETLQTFTMTYRYDKEKYAVMKSAVDKRVEEILALTAKVKTVYNKLITIHDEIIKNCRVDETAAEKSSVYGALVDGRADSFGYAEAFCLIAGKAGIRSFVNIYTRGNVTYARSTIYSDSFWYNIDCARDDSSRLASNESYTYFMVPDRLYADCSPYLLYFVPPEAIAVNNYYYKILGLEAAGDAEAQNLIVKLITENPGQSTFRFSFPDDAAFDGFLKTVTETSFLTDTLDIASGAVSIITDAADISFSKKSRVVTLVVYSPNTALTDYYSDTSYFTEEKLSYLNSLGLN
ncbi:MAG: hypothetical protein LBL98_00250 [Ruminococcus sp.]|jgi:hypothetical protein|nr:hypothetical protein [Ruminococcus sp.]